jgi:hypothetical protein
MQDRKANQYQSKQIVNGEERYACRYGYGFCPIFTHFGGCNVTNNGVRCLNEDTLGTEMNRTLPKSPKTR